MIIVQIMGGLGNQLFQYALYKSFMQKGIDVRADKINYETGIDPREYQLGDITEDTVLATVRDRRSMAMDASTKFRKQLRNAVGNHIFLYEEKANFVFDREVLKQKRGYFRGYWQTEKYFADVRDDVRAGIRFPEVGQGYVEVQKEIENTCSISVHIRRGDYLKSQGYFGNLPESGYYERAMDYMEEKLKEPVFFVFSDDIEWCQQRFAGRRNIKYVTDMSAHPYDDMHLMTLCRHNIMANSSFSWWGAYLGKQEGRIVTAPSQWTIIKETPDIWCEEWVKL